MPAFLQLSGITGVLRQGRKKVLKEQDAATLTISDISVFLQGMKKVVEYACFSPTDNSAMLTISGIVGVL